MAGLFFWADLFGARPAPKSIGGLFVIIINLDSFYLKKKKKKNSIAK